MKDIKYIALNFLMSFMIVTIAFMADLSEYYKIAFLDGARYLFAGDVYSLTYFGMLVLFVVVAFELIKIVMDGLGSSYFQLVYFIHILSMMVIYFLPIFHLFKLIIEISLFVSVIRISIKQKIST